LNKADQIDRQQLMRGTSIRFRQLTFSNVIWILCRLAWTSRMYFRCWQHLTDTFTYCSLWSFVVVSW
jgi:hypothetical protein